MNGDNAAVYRLDPADLSFTATGRGSDATDDEIKAIAILPDGTFFAAGTNINQQRGVIRKFAENLDLLLERSLELPGRGLVSIDRAVASRAGGVGGRGCSRRFLPLPALLRDRGEVTERTGGVYLLR